eukprot:4101996-Alexandrium_andersonii.AAC.1
MQVRVADRFGPRIHEAPSLGGLAPYRKQMPSPQPAKRDSRSPSRRRGRAEPRADIPPVPLPPARRAERASPARG